jgi:hypothetical protein
MRRLPAFPGTSKARAGPESPSLAGGEHRGDGHATGERGAIPCGRGRPPPPILRRFAQDRLEGDGGTGMGNPHGKCDICLQRHRPGNCKGEGGGGRDRRSDCQSMQSIAILAAGLARILLDLADLIEQFPIPTANARRTVTKERPFGSFKAETPVVRTRERPKC